MAMQLCPQRRGRDFPDAGRGGWLPSTQAPAPVTVQVADRGPLISVAQGKTEFFFRTAKVAGGCAQDMFSVSGSNAEGGQGEGFSHGRAGAEQAVEGNPHTCSAEGRGCCLCQQVTCKKQTNVCGLQACFSNGQGGCLFLHSAFCCFPGGSTEHRIRTDHVKAGAQRASLLLSVRLQRHSSG